jgi:hypothetical protein
MAGAQTPEVLRKLAELAESLQRVEALARGQELLLGVAPLAPGAPGATPTGATRDAQRQGGARASTPREALEGVAAALKAIQVAVAGVQGAASPATGEVSTSQGGPSRVRTRAHTGVVQPRGVALTAGTLQAPPSAAGATPPAEKPRADAEAADPAAGAPASHAQGLSTVSDLHLQSQIAVEIDRSCRIRTALSSDRDRSGTL